MEGDIVFALDIGTRSVVGVVLEGRAPDVSVRAVRVVAHETRAMVDGQIHDVEAVAAKIAVVRRELEDETGLSLTHAAVAAAGRALRTAKARVERERRQYHEISRTEMHALELEAVQQAQMDMASTAETESAASEYFCVGYSVVSYYLDGHPIGNLVGQVGRRVAVDVIATFLPRVVVDSLFSALRRAGLEVRSLTLEPIAALEVAIPPQMRLLNLALVDIGAGTSDIALVRKGQVFAYAMVPVGGDEITERIAEEYLLDFNAAEELKCRLVGRQRIEFEDILGNPLEAATDEVIERFQDVVRDLAVRVAREVLVLNQRAPDAVVCVGGGSLTPRLLSELAAALEIPRNRVGVRAREAIKEVKGDFPELRGPIGVTPIGIGFHALRGEPLPYIRVSVNGRDIPLWSLAETTVAAALLSAGISLNNLYGRTGMGLTVEVNGQVRHVKGELGAPPDIRVDGREAALDTPLCGGEHVEFVRGRDGRAAHCTVRDLLPDASGEVMVNGERMEVVPRVLLDGREVGMDCPVHDRAVITYTRADSLGRILARAGVDEDLLQEKVYRYQLNGQPMVFRWRPVEVSVGGRPASLEDPVLFGSSVEYRVRGEAPRLRDVVSLPEGTRSIRVKVNGQPVLLPSRRAALEVNSLPAALDEPLRQGADIVIREREHGAIVSDVLGLVQVNARTAGKLVMRVDGEKAGFTTPVREGSEVEIFWRSDAIG
ncbi:MAG: cell division FtsA domain-containing protein [Syntrophomonadaceae bacterium]|jgi:cell division protein FtsA|nr:cell division FtsA domain-containing protein [Syntrophomonadaceae bacterium]